MSIKDIEDTFGKDIAQKINDSESIKMKLMIIVIILPNSQTTNLQERRRTTRKCWLRCRVKYSEKERSDAEDRGIMLPTNNEKNVFSSSHFSEPNILVHLRMNTRTDSEGNKVLFLEEVQSDWGQKGKKEGFANIDKFPDGYRIEEPSKFIS